MQNNRHNLSASLEDYIEAIYNLTGRSSVARSKDIAQMLGVAKPSVTGALKALKKKGLVNYKPYDYITLTESGQVVAAEVVEKHNVLKAFFTNVLGIEKDIAQKAACKAEHTLGSEVTTRLLHFVDFVNVNNNNGYHLADEFKKFYQDCPRMVGGE